MVHAVQLAFALVSAQDIFLKDPSFVALTSDEAAKLASSIEVPSWVTLTDDEAANLTGSKGLCCNCKANTECSSGMCDINNWHKCIKSSGTTCNMPPAPDCSPAVQVGLCCNCKADRECKICLCNPSWNKCIGGSMNTTCHTVPDCSPISPR